jgi:2-methylisocitrate lyase-like PEP mutase family enzyme
MAGKNTVLRSYLKQKKFLHMPAVYDPLFARLVEQSGFECAYVGGWISGSSRCISEPLLTMTEQITIAKEAADSIRIPLVCDAGAAFGEPLHAMRTVREFIKAGISGVHIEDQVYPKRAHYHHYQVDEIPTEDFATKIKYACKARDELDPDFVIIARSDTCRARGLQEACDRVNRAAEESGADLGLVFPRNRDDAEKAPRMCRLPLVYVIAHGTRDNRPMFSRQELIDMGYAVGLDPHICMLTAFNAVKPMLAELREKGEFKGISEQQFVTLRKDIEDLQGIEEFCQIEMETVRKDL